MTAITPTIPLDAPGKHHGFLRLPYSRNDSAWGSVMIPLTVIRGGDGPTALLTGGFMYSTLAAYMRLLVDRMATSGPT